MSRGRHAKPTNTKRNLQRAALITAGAGAPLAFASGAFADELVVEQGDTVSEIAIEKLGLPEWQTFYQENRGVIGDNPDLIFPGQKLAFADGLVIPGGAPVPVEEVAPEPPVQVEIEPQGAENPPAEVLEQAAVEAGADLPQAIITNSAGPVSSRAQTAANNVWAHVPGASFLTIGGTRGSAIDMAGHPSGNALDYMVGNDQALGHAIFQYHMDNWDALGVDYIIWEQRYYGAPAPLGSGRMMENRGGRTANHYDHPHVNYKPAP